MDCSICSALPYILRPPRNTICGACYEGARSIIALTTKIENDKPTTNNPNSSSNSNKLRLGIKFIQIFKSSQETTSPLYPLIEPYWHQGQEYFETCSIQMNVKLLQIKL